MTTLERDRGSPAAHSEYQFDPVCGSRLPALYRVNPYDDGQRTFYFCSESCRIYFMEHRHLQKQSSAERTPPAH